MLRDQGQGHIQTRTVLLLSYFLRVNIHQLHSTTGCCVLDFVAVWACFVTNETRFLNTAYTVFICKRSEYKNRCICFWYLITDIAGSCLLIPSVYMQCSNSSCPLLSHSRFCNAAWLKKHLWHLGKWQHPIPIHWMPVIFKVYWRVKHNILAHTMMKDICLTLSTRH